MQRCFETYRRVLKPGRWITVVFHNSRNAIWNAIQEAMLAAGFVVADVRTLDKQQGSYRQVTSTAVKQDLVISAYKPNGGLEERFRLQAGTEEGAWDFVRSHLQSPPRVRRRARPASRRRGAQRAARRRGRPRRGHRRAPELPALRPNGRLPRPTRRHGPASRPPSSTPASGSAFPNVTECSSCREQVAAYDPRRLAAREIVQLELFVRDEETAIQLVAPATRAEAPNLSGDPPPLHPRARQAG